MYDPVTFALPFGQGLGLAALVVMLHSELVRLSRRWPWVPQIGGGFVFAAGAVAAMLEPVTLAPGVVIDARNVLVGLAGPFTGAVGALIAACAAGSYRLWLGGGGAAAGVTGIAVAAFAGVAFRATTRREPHELGFRDLLILGCATSLSLASIALLPGSTALDFLSRAGLPYVVANVLGIVVFGSLLVRERRRLVSEELVRTAARTDPLTGLCNRRAFNKALENDFTDAQHRERALSVLLIDVDRFKAINDTHGHDRGDAALVAVAKILRRELRDDDVVARLGGDEFAVVLPSTTLAKATELAQRISDAVRTGSVAECGVPVSVSIGAASRSPVMRGPGELLKAADVMLYEVKRRGRSVSMADILAA